MPTDPRTGKSLPYPGEPGYEEAMAANPDVYAQDGMTADPAMMGQDPAMMGQDRARLTSFAAGCHWTDGPCPREAFFCKSHWDYAR